VRYESGHSPPTRVKKLPRNGIVTKAGWITTAIVALPIAYAASALRVAPAVETSRTAQLSSESLRFESATRIASLATQTVSGLLARDITGTWQGKLMVPQAPNGEIRIVFKILKADEGLLRRRFT
jgi:hypothetical protein